MIQLFGYYLSLIFSVNNFGSEFTYLLIKFQINQDLLI